MLYEKLLTAVEETSTFGLEWGSGTLPDIIQNNDTTLSGKTSFPSFDFGIPWFLFQSKLELAKAVHEELPSSKI